MSGFPVADPIPLPAPVWLMKLLSLLTLGLHFAAVMMLVGSLLLVVILNFRGRTAKNLDWVRASHVLAKRLPVVMTYVINLGVPPLLFLQVLYGRQIYSSSVLIGTIWIAVIPLLILAYWLLYKCIAQIEASKAGWLTALISLLVVMGIGQIYAMNMTLMLRPELWNEMYQSSPVGLRGFSGDPTTTPRWMFVMAGGPMFGGLWAALLSNMVYLSDSVRTTLRRAGSVSAVTGAALMLFFGYRVISLQTPEVAAGIKAIPLVNLSMLLCGVTIALAGIVGVLQVKRTNVWLSSVGIVVGFLAAATSTIVRDGIRDVVLKAKGFDVNDVQVYPNWSVLVVFLLLFVIMLGVIYWLLQVMRQATPPKEEVSL
ncbi:MAG TPA: hypothetical protein PKA27_06420 [Fimbriimonadaceae bacterium]|nr:hypothetical protein [Fimbriimonadaceae bacterium]